MPKATYGCCYRQADFQSNTTFITAFPPESSHAPWCQWDNVERSLSSWERGKHLTYSALVPLERGHQAPAILSIWAFRVPCLQWSVVASWPCPVDIVSYDPHCMSQPLSCTVWPKPPCCTHFFFYFPKLLEHRVWVSY